MHESWNLVCYLCHILRYKVVILFATYPDLNIQLCATVTPGSWPGIALGVKLCNMSNLGIVMLMRRVENAENHFFMCTFFTETNERNYSWLSLSRPRLSRITAYLEVKIWSLAIHENLTTDGKYCRKEEKLLLRSNFSSFPQYFQYISNFKSPITYQFVKCG